MLAVYLHHGIHVSRDLVERAGIAPGLVLHEDAHEQRRPRGDFHAEGEIGFPRLFDFGILLTSRHRQKAIGKRRRVASCARMWAGLCPVSWNLCFAFISSYRIAYPIRRFNRRFFPEKMKNLLNASFLELFILYWGIAD